MVVYLSVENDPATLVFIRHRLVATGNIDDGKASMCQTYRTIDPDACSVWSTVALHLRHTPQTRAFYPFPLVVFQNSGYRTHGQAVFNIWLQPDSRRYTSPHAGPTFSHTQLASESFARCAMSTDRSGHCRRYLAALAIAAGSPTWTRVPDIPSSIMFGVSPTAVATIGMPQAIASRTDRESLSTKDESRKMEWT